jgi:hypothetical protein
MILVLPGARASGGNRWADKDAAIINELRRIANGY